MTRNRRTFGPLREVVHIEDCKPGRNGGRAWILTLSCGHLAVRFQPRFSMGRAMTRGLRDAKAPQSCRCHSCGELAELALPVPNEAQ